MSGDYFLPSKDDERNAVADRALKVADMDVERACVIANAMYPNDSYGCEMLRNRKKVLDAYRTRLMELKEIPICEQRSDAWHAMRHTMITASDFAQAVGKGKFGTASDFIIKKVRPTAFPSASSCPPLAWGVMFESVASDVYARKLGCKMHEFGLIKHPTVGFLGASPDAITDDGVMVEIKAPYKRKITGQVPMQYYYQIQGQLEVCDLEECDYLECKFELLSQDAWQSLSPDETYGIVVEHKDDALDANTPKHVYSDAGADMDTQLTWLECDVLSSTDDDHRRVHRINFWRLEGMFVCRIRRDREFWAGLQSELKDVWDKVLEYRTDEDKFRKEMIRPSSSLSSLSSQGRAVKSRKKLEDTMGFLAENYGFTQN